MDTKLAGSEILPAQPGGTRRPKAALPQVPLEKGVKPKVLGGKPGMH